MKLYSLGPGIRLSFIICLLACLVSTTNGQSKHSFTIRGHFNAPKSIVISAVVIQSDGSGNMTASGGAGLATSK